MEGREKGPKAVGWKVAEEKLVGADAGSAGNAIRVTIRCRPFNGRETAEGSQCAVVCEDKEVSCEDTKRLGEKKFRFDAVFGTDATQQELFEDCGLPVVANAFNAYNGCIFAYGQTGAGKTFSTVGDVRKPDQMGILPRACTELFDKMQERKEQEQGFEATILATYLEIYNEKLKDLLSSGAERPDLSIQSHPNLGTIVTNLTECPLESFEDAVELLDFGAKNRAVAATNMNATSSRSHAIFTIQMRMDSGRGTSKAVQRFSRLHFVDLAGSERQKKTGAEGDRLKEGVAINQSLTTLGRVISQLTTQGGAKVQPAFRDSKLTMFLKDALVGNSKTTLLACISPAQMNLEETVGTLEFASRCKLIRTAAKRNEESKVALVTKLAQEKAEIEALLRVEREQSEAAIRALQAQLEQAMKQSNSKKSVFGLPRIFVTCCAGQKQSLEQQLKTMARELGEDGPGDGGRVMGQKSSLVLDTSTVVDLDDIKVGTEIAVSEKSSNGFGILKGVVRFVGETTFRAGLWVGVELAAPRGRHGGCVEGMSYFKCPDDRGIFIRKEGVMSCAVLQQPVTPGLFRVLADVLITASPEAGSSTVIRVRRGMFLNVKDIREVDKLVRGSIEEPVVGWVSIRTVQGTEMWLARDHCPTRDEAKGAAMRKTINQYSMQILELEEEEKKAKTLQSEEEELRNKLEAECKMRHQREAELLAQVAAVQEAHKIYTLEADEVRKLRDMQHAERLASLSKMGLSCVNVSPEDLDTAPRLLNMHPDPALNGCLVFVLPRGETSVGADPSRCQVLLSGAHMAGKVCTITNEQNRVLRLNLVGGGLVHVNGRMVEESGCTLEDGDRLAFGHAYIFQVQILLNHRRRGSFDIMDDEFATALQEIAGGTEVDPKFQNCIEKALVLVKSDFGTDASQKMLAQARRASEACSMANGVLKQMPENWRGEVERFELSIMFDAHGLPEVCIVARRRLESVPGDREEVLDPTFSSSVAFTASASPFSKAALRRRVGLSAGIWEVEQFWQERLPVMFEALSDSGLGGSQLHHEEPALTSWEARAWAEVPMDDYRRLCRQNRKLREQLASARSQLQAMGCGDSDLAGSPNGKKTGFMGRFMEASGLFGKSGKHTPR